MKPKKHAYLKSPKRGAAAFLRFTKPFTVVQLQEAMGLAASTDAANRCKWAMNEGHLSRKRVGRVFEYAVTPAGRKAFAAILGDAPVVTDDTVTLIDAEKRAYQHPALISFETKTTAMTRYYTAALKQLQDRMPTPALKEEVERVLAFAP